MIDLVIEVLGFTSAVFAAALLAVLFLRKALRKFLGAEIIYSLWGMPVLALIVLAIPKPAQVISIAPVTQTGVVTMDVMPMLDAVAQSFYWQPWLIAAWVLGVAFVGAVMCLRQRRFRAQLLAVQSGEQARLPAASGPAVIGAWRPQLALPADFETRYSTEEQALVLLHEQVHIRRRDGIANLFAAILKAVFWFNPLVYWAYRAYRQDQELACDAAVLRAQPHAANHYAQAMLKTEFSFQALPVGCHWQEFHPVVERIAMLKQHVKLAPRRGVGLGIIFVAALATAGLVYASSPAPVAYAAANNQAAETAAQIYYHVAADIEVTTHSNGARNARKSAVQMVAKSGEVFAVGISPDGTSPGTSSQGIWLEMTATPAGDQAVMLKGKIASHQGAQPFATPELITKLGSEAEIRISDQKEPGFVGKFLVTQLTAEEFKAFKSASDPEKASAEIAAEGRVNPVYPKSMLELKMGGKVMLNVKIMPEGNVAEVRVMAVELIGESKDSPQLSAEQSRQLSKDIEKSAVDAVQQWQFESTPETEAIESPRWVKIPITFTLNESSSKKALSAQKDNAANDKIQPAKQITLSKVSETLAASNTHPAPRYPAEMAREGVGAEVMLKVKVGSDGVPNHVELQTINLRSYKEGAAELTAEQGTRFSQQFETAAIEQVKLWKFNVATIEPQSSGELWVQVPIKFSLKEG